MNRLCMEKADMIFRKRELPKKVNAVLTEDLTMEGMKEEEMTEVEVATEVVVGREATVETEEVSSIKEKVEIEKRSL